MAATAQSEASSPIIKLKEAQQLYERYAIILRLGSVGCTDGSPSCYGKQQCAWSHAWKLCKVDFAIQQLRVELRFRLEL